MFALYLVLCGCPSNKNDFIVKFPYGKVKVVKMALNASYINIYIYILFIRILQVLHFAKNVSILTKNYLI